MSQRFFFDVSNGDETIPDEAGIEAATVDEVLAEARDVIIEMADEAIGIDLDQRWTMVVRDAAGSIVGRLPIKR
ncbi:hypothetical protein MKK67_29050 [Methylobacterium sp. J-072]|uniref:DUF6894 family protein n=1 Tax=Methylobacterium sp. J-072 TaxID=2836651 RepID=UPI001FB963FF|nr:hypothetical protein [Methylobacterium sp. J-072]MCJ2096524.1 hypothetical protein [Methylobacterium sp. J-072]